MKSAFVSLVGRPSSGKSTLLNRMCGEKVSIVSRVPQTTRNKIRGIVNRPDGQLVFIDTPGFHTSEKKMNRRLTDLVKSALDEVDIALYLVDISRPMGDEERALMGILEGFKGDLVVALSKVDIPADFRDDIESELRAWKSRIPVMPISALTGEGVEELLQMLLFLAPEGELSYPREFYTDQEPEFRIAEIIREKALKRTYQELPHAIYVEIADLEKSGDAFWIRAFLCVERESQKAILIGKGGSRIREIRLESEEELKAIFGHGVKLHLQVKVRRGWRQRDVVIRKIVR